MNHTVDEQMVWALAQHARPDDIAVVGVATPMATAAALLARETIAPGLTVIIAATVQPAVHNVASPMLDPAFLDRFGVGTFGQTEILDQIQKGVVTLQFVSPAQVDGAGRLNTSRVKRPDGSWLRLPGGLATADIAVLVGRLVAYRADHSPRFLSRRVDFGTGAGRDSGAEWRTARGLPGAGVCSIITDRAVLEWSGTGFGVASIHPGSSLEDVVAGCGFEPSIPAGVVETPSPPAEALEVLRRVIDPHGIRRLEIKTERSAAQRTLYGLASDG